MPTNEISSHLDLIICLFVLAYLVFWRYTEYRLDCLRQDLFDLRGEIFDDAKNGLISFDHPMYGLMRTTINGYIRFAHRMSIWQVFLLLVFLRGDRKKIKSTFRKQYVDLSKTLTREQYVKFEGYKDRMHFTITFNLILNSFVATFLLALTIFAALVHGLYKRIKLRKEINAITKPQVAPIGMQAVAIEKTYASPISHPQMAVTKKVFKHTERLCGYQFDGVDSAAYACGTRG